MTDETVQAILDCIKKNPTYDGIDIAVKLGLSVATVYEVLLQLVEAGQVERVYSGIRTQLKIKELVK